MEETHGQKKLYRDFQIFVYLTVVVEIIAFLGPFKLAQNSIISQNIVRLSEFTIYQSILYSKLFTLCIIVIVAIGSKPKKKIDLNITKSIIAPMIVGISVVITSMVVLYKKGNALIVNLNLFDLTYIVCSFVGMILIHIALDNISKIIRVSLMDDRFNTVNESFDQQTQKITNQYSVNIPMKFFFRKKINRGWINITNPFRGTIVIGTPGSGKTMSIILQFIRQHLSKGFSMLVYDYKFPDLGKTAYNNYLFFKKRNPKSKMKFHVVNLNDVSKSRRVNPLKPMYIQTLSQASETAEGLVEALKKSDKASGADQFFTASAVNFLTAVIYYLAKLEKGKYSSLPHVLSFINQSYDKIFPLLMNQIELESIMSPFRSAYDKRAFDQLEGQIGTLKINLSRIASKEAYWVFSGDDVNLNISDPESQSVFVLANDPRTQNTNSASYSLLVNQICKLANQKGKTPLSIIVDEVPTIYLHKIENLIATARSNKVSILLGLQELTQFRQQYGKQVSDTITSVVGNVISGSARAKETLDWLEKIFGKIKQLQTGVSIDHARASVSMNARMDYLIPASKIADLKSGEMVGIIAQESNNYSVSNKSNTINCKVDVNIATEKNLESRYIDTPTFYTFESKEKMDTTLMSNMKRINDEIKSII